MATILTDAEFLDLVKGTLRSMDKPKWENIAQELQYYEVMSKWMKSDRIIEGDGRAIVRYLLTNIPNAGRHVGNLEEDDVNIENLMDEIEIPFVRYTTNWAITLTEVQDNSGESLIFNVMEPRRTARMVNTAAILEDTAWAAPSATDSRLPWGVPYYVVKNATQGFNGGAPSGFTTVAGLNPSTVTDWKNYTDTYSTKSYTDLVEKLDLAMIRTRFISPVSVPDNRTAAEQRFRLYVNVDTGINLKRLYREQNQDLGTDLAIKDGMLTVKGHSIVPLPILDSDTTDPVYGLDMATFHPVVKAGMNFRESEPQRAPRQHDALVVYYDHRYNYLCTNRKANFVMYAA